jgi:acetyl-CoA decarbonylase/synthase complex subunit delta
MGIGKAFLTSRKFLFADGGFKRLVWMPRELKEALSEDLKPLLDDMGEADLFEKIADETLATEADALRKHLEKANHPALALEDMALFAESADTGKPQTGASAQPAAPKPAAPKPAAQEGATGTKSASSSLSAGTFDEIKQAVISEILGQIRTTLSDEIAQQVIAALRGGNGAAAIASAPHAADAPVVLQSLAKPSIAGGPSAEDRLNAITTVPFNRTASDTPVWEVTLGATREQGGTRGKTVTVGGASCMPFHLWEGRMPHAPVAAMEVFDLVSEKFPAVLRECYGKALENAADMAKLCVEKFNAELISVRLEGTHPEKGNYSVQQAVDTVSSVLEAVDVPLIITGHGHFDKTNEVLKAVAQACNGERLLLNWVEQNNYRTIAGAAMAYNHCLVAQSPIDVNIGKQMNILLTNMDIKQNQIIMDPMTGALGYGIEYTYSVMERIRLTALGGDAMLAGPMIVTPGQECAKIKELRAPRTDFPEWGDLGERAALWETTTALNLLYAGADILVLYHPESVKTIQKTIRRLMERE